MYSSAGLAASLTVAGGAIFVLNNLYEKVQDLYARSKISMSVKIQFADLVEAFHILDTIDHCLCANSEQVKSALKRASALIPQFQSAIEGLDTDRSDRYSDMEELLKLCIHEKNNLMESIALELEAIGGPPREQVRFLGLHKSLDMSEFIKSKFLQYSAGKISKEEVAQHLKTKFKLFDLFDRYHKHKDSYIRFLGALLEETNRKSQLALTKLSHRPKQPFLSSLRQRLRLIRTCRILITLGVLTILGSVIPAIWRSVASKDLSGGFAMAQYILAVGMLVLGCVSAIHVKTCTCWEKRSAGE